jgi:hypothetical protein
VKSLDDLECLAAEKLENPRPLRKAKNGPLIPDTSGQKWHYLENVSYGRSGGGNLLQGNLLGGRHAVLGGGIMSFEETFEQDNVFVSMRFPYTYGYNEAFLTELAQDFPWVKVHNVGKSKEGRNLRVVQIGEGVDREGKQKPTVVVYAREHGNEHDTSFAAEGAIRFLVSDEDAAIEARLNLCFIVIPLLDPDGASGGKYNNITESYFFGDQIPEALAYSAWFKKWMDDGNRLDLILNLHNVRSFGSPHLFCPEIEPQRFADFQTFHQFVMKELSGFEIRKDPSQRGNQLFRLGGWLKNYYGPLCVPYELNTQAPSRHLTMNETRQMGVGLVVAAVKYLESEQSKSLRDGVTKILQQRQERWNKFAKQFEDATPLLAEQKCRQMEKTVAARKQNAKD